MKIPEGWTVATIGELVSSGPTNGYSPASHPQASGSLSLRLGATTTGRLLLTPQTTRRIDEVLPDDSPLWLEPGDLLVQRSNTRELVGTAAIYDGPPRTYLYPDTMMRLRFADAAVTRWIWRFMNGPLGRRWVGQYARRFAGSMPKISGERLRRLAIVLPPENERARRLRLLDGADELRSKRRQGVLLSDALMRSVFLDMFGDPLGNPQGWATIPLGEICDFTGGGTPSRSEPSYFQGDICWATCKDLGDEELTDTQEHITAQAIERSRTKRVPAGTILVVVKSKVLLRRLPVAITLVPTCFGQDVKGLRPHPEWPAGYLARHLRLGQDSLLNKARGANTEGLTLDHLRSYRVMAPPPQLREEYCRREARIRSLQESLRRGEEEAERLFEAALHGAFQGAA